MYRANLAIVAIFKQESRRLAEWLAWHRMVGCDQFLLYDNGPVLDPATHRILAPYVASGLARVTHMPGPRKQTDAYWHARNLVNREKPAAWTAFIDLDEFLQPMDGFRTVPEALEDFERADIAGVVASWANFGSNGHHEPPPLCVTGFTRRSDPWFRWNQLVKQLIRPDRCGSHVNPHEFPAYPRYRVVDMLGRTHTGPFLSPPVWERLRCVHFNSRSRVEYEEKLKRGYADQDTPRPDTWDELDRNEVEDFSLAIRAPELQAWLSRPGCASLPAPCDDSGICHPSPFSPMRMI
jgi:hypothetical protein